MAKQTETMPEQAFMESLDSLEALVKGMVPVADGDEMGDPVDPDTQVDEVADLDQDLAKADPADDGDDKDGDPDDDDLEKCGGAAKDLKKSEADSFEDPAGDAQEYDSFAEELAAGSEEIQKAIEVSDFLADLVGKVGEAIDQMRQTTLDRLDAMEKSLAEATQVQQQVAENMVQTLRKSYQAVAEKTDLQADELRKSLDTLNLEIAKAPARGPKSKTHVLSKSFEGEGSAPQITKETILKSLTDLFEQGDPNVTSMDIIRFESGGALAPHVKKRLGLE